jgi:multicomponent Na+:H+ antiporter subunit F
MTHFLFGVALFLLATLIAGMRRIIRGPSRADRMLAAQLFGTTGVAILLVLAEATGDSSVVDVALVFALLAIINVTVFVHHAWRSSAEE